MKAFLAGSTLEASKFQYPSRLRNPLIADICFKGGYIDAWGRGTLKIINTCLEAGLPEPEIKEQDGGMLVQLFKNTSTSKQLPNNLNERQKQAIMYVKEKGKITNAEYQKLFKVSRITASRDLSQMVKEVIFLVHGNKGRGTFYSLL